MEKITFTDTEVIKQPYITINNQEYELEEGTYSGGTDLDADTFNTMQDHIEEAINETKNIELIAISDTAPTTCSTGDKYYNTEDNLIYTATGTNTWGSTGEEPIKDIFYILFSEQSSYSYDGTTLVSVGGGTEDIIISDEEPTSDDWKLWIDTGEISAQASEITNSYSESTGIGYSANYSNEHFSGVELYNNTSGTNGNVTLSDSADNYNYIEIFFGNSSKTKNDSTKVSKGLYSTTLKIINISKTSTNQNTQEFYKDIAISGTTISVVLNRSVYITSNVADYSTATITQGSDNLVYIYKVIGYK